MSTKFGLLIDFDLLKTVTCYLAVAAAILKNGYDVIFLHISELNNYTGNLVTVVLAHYTRQHGKGVDGLFEKVSFQTAFEGVESA